MRVIFPQHPLQKGMVEPEFEAEEAAAMGRGFESILFDYDLFNYEGTLKVETGGGNCIYRGWMMKPQQYLNFYIGLKGREFSLVNDPAQYKACHYFPEVYDKVKEFSPLTRWASVQEIMDGSDDFINNFIAFDSGAFIIKDYVKSQKGTTLFKASSNTKPEDFKSIVTSFVNMSGNTFSEGIVLKEFVDLKKYEGVTNEWRCFIYKGEIISCDYNVEGDRPTTAPDTSFLKNVIPNIPSNFFTIDLAEKADGSWMIVECGDGQVSFLTPHTNASQFYSHFNR